MITVIWFDMLYVLVNFYHTGRQHIGKEMKEICWEKIATISLRKSKIFGTKTVCKFKEPYRTYRGYSFEVNAP